MRAGFHALVLGLYGAAVTLSAFLLFVVQPYAGRLLLPRLGGPPSVWTACLLFFQATLLVGYGWGWLSRRVASRPVRVGLHLLLLVVAGLALPPVPPADLVLDGDAPTLEALGFLARTVGLPFLALSTTAPMLQAWLAESAHPAREKPYVLYAASNAGSLVSLLVYPTLIEPLLGLGDQSRAFSVGYAGLVVLVAAAAVMLLRRPGEVLKAEDAPAATPRERLRWIALAAVPAALLSSVTSYLSTDLSPMPLLWVGPLAIYLFTFVLAFRRTDAEADPRLSRIARMLGATLVVAVAVHANDPLVLLVGLHLGFFGLAAFVVHRRLARAAPPPARLTEFYVMTALGGVVGTLLSGPVATFVLPDLWEYPIAIAAACALTVGKPDATPLRERLKKDGPVAALVLLVTVALAIGIAYTPLSGSPFAALVVFGAPIVVAYSQSLVPVRYGLCLLAVVLGGTLFSERGTTLLRRERDFFGVLRVVDDGEDRVLLHGTTLHGAQRRDAREGCEPLAYYARSGPLGAAIDAFRSSGEPGDVSAIGLGAGSVACYARPGERWTFSEISAAVAAVASDASLFTYLANAEGEVELHVEDGRRGLEAVAAGSRALVLVDAFSSDAVPAHLLTVEAMRAYVRALRPGGWVLFHVSNRSLDLVRIVTATAAAEGLAVRVNADASEVGGVGGAPSWMVLARTESDLSRLDAAGGFMRPPPSSAAPWTDDRASLWSALR